MGDRHQALTLLFHSVPKSSDPDFESGPKCFPPGLHPLHQWAHAKLAGDGQGFVQQRRGLGSVIYAVPLSDVRVRCGVEMP